MTWFAYPEDEGTTGSTDREKWDKNAAANLATLMYEGNAADYVVTGFDVSVSAGEATVSPGLARVSDVSANDHTEDEVRDWGVTYAVGLSDPVTVPVSDGDTLHIAFDATQGDGGSIETNGAAVGIEIASIESGAAVPTNRNPSAAFQDASVETAPSSPTDVARKQEVDENATTIGGKADDPHGDAAHSEDYAKTGESQPPETHGDTEHDVTVPSQTEVDGKASDPHGSEAHSEDYAVDGDAQPPETHGDTEHDTTVPSTSDVDAVSTDLSGHEAADGDVHGVVSPDTVAGKSDVDDHEASTGDVHGVAAGDSVASQSDVDGKASDPHGNEAHSDTFATDGDTQPPETHGDVDHDTTVPSQTDVDGKASDPHDNTAHSETYAVDGTAQPPEAHGDGDHDATVPGFDADASEFSGAAGTPDQVLQTDGTNATWADSGGGGAGGEPDAIARQSISDPALPIDDVVTLYDSVTQADMDAAMSSIRSDNDAMRAITMDDISTWNISRSGYALDQIAEQSASARDVLLTSSQFQGYLLFNPTGFYALDSLSNDWWYAAAYGIGGTHPPSPWSGDLGSNSRMMSSMSSNDPQDEDAEWNGNFHIPEWADKFRIYMEPYDADWYVDSYIRFDGTSESPSSTDGNYDIYDLDGYRGTDIDVRISWSSNVTGYTSASASFGDMEFYSV